MRSLPLYTQGRIQTSKGRFSLTERVKDQKKRKKKRFAAGPKKTQHKTKRHKHLKRHSEGTCGVIAENARDTRFSLLFLEAYGRRKPQQQSEPISALSNSTAPTRFTCACALAHTHAHARMCMCKHPFHQVIGASYAELAGRNTGFAIGPTGKQFDEINEHFVLTGDARC